MADVITRFKLETTQYDSKLRDAAKALSDYSRQAENAGKNFDTVTKSQIEAARAFGNVATSATNSKDKVKELVGAYNEVAKAYNNLTNEQKKSDFGKAMAESLDKLQGRIREAKAEMNSVGGVLDKLAGKLTINIDAMKLFNVGVQAAGAALNVAKDAFFASESTVDEWGRVMDESRSLYEGFLTALNTGDISGYLNNINDIVKAARAAYDELDRLGTMKTIQKPAISAQQTENERIRAMIQTRRYIAPVDGRRATMKNGQLLTDTQVKTLERQLQNGIKTVVSLVSNEVKQSNRAIDAVYNRQAKELGLSLKEFRIGTSSMEEFDKRMEGYRKYVDFEREHTYNDGRSVVDHRDNAVNPYEQFKKWGVFRVDGNRYNDLVDLIMQRDQQTSSVYGMQAQAFKTVNRAEGITSRVGGGRSGSGGGKGGVGVVDIVDKDDFSEMEEIVGLIALQRQKVKDLQEQIEHAPDETFITYMRGELQVAQEELDRLTGKTKTTGEAITQDLSAPLLQMSSILKQLNDELAHAETPEAYQNILADIKAINQEMENFKGNTGVTELNKSGKNADKSWRDASSAVQSVGSALQQIEDPGAKIAGLIGQAVANIALGFAQATTAAAAGGPFAWIAAIAGGLATMTSTIAAIHSATGFQNGGIVQGAPKKYATGGIIQGNTYSSDMIPIRANAGELILNRAQQGNIASQLEGTASQNLRLYTDVSGRNLRIIMDNDSMSRGKGKFVTSNNR